MPPRSPFPLLTTPSDSRTAMLQGLLIGIILIAGLYVGPRGAAAARPRHPVELRADPAAPPAPQDQGAARVRGWHRRGRRLRLHLRPRLDDVARSGRSRGRSAEIQRHAVGEDHGAVQQHERIEGAAKGRRRADRLAAAARPAVRCSPRRQASALRLCRPTRQADPGRDSGARTVRLGSLSDYRRHAAAAARHRRHCAAVRHLHPAPAGRFARPGDQTGGGRICTAPPRA